jgi:hypothetical protein
MPLQVQCACGASYRVGEDWRGRKVRCQRCRAVFAVAPEEAIPEVPIEVIDEETRRARVIEQEEPPRQPRKKDTPKRKKRRRDEPEHERWMTLDERLAMRRAMSTRPDEVRRGWRFLYSGLALIACGVLFTSLLAAIEAEAGFVGGRGFISIVYAIAGIWGPLLFFGILGLIACVLGVLNFLGIAIVIEESED